MKAGHNPWRCLMRSKSPAYLIMAALCCLVAAACSSDSNGGNGIIITPGTGNLYLSLTGVPTNLYKAVYVKIDEVQVHTGGDEEVAGNWETVATPMEIYNLLELVNGKLEQLGTTALDAGTYQQMRLIIGAAPTDGINILGVSHPFANYVIDLDNKTHGLEIPSAVDTGIKIVHTFRITANSTTELILDFDASASVIQAGIGNNWQLMPSIYVIDSQEHASITGIVSELADSGTSGIAGALVNLQYENPGANDPKDIVTTLAATVSAEKDNDNNYEKGEYVLLTNPGSYRLVSYKVDYDVGCADIDAVAGQTTVQDVELAPAATGTVEGNVSIGSESTALYATLSFRKPVLCEGMASESTLEIQSVNVTAGYWYQVSLPVGTYSLAASGTDLKTVVYDGIVVTDSEITYQDVSLSP